MNILNYFKNLFDSSDDPVKHCELYRDEGCAHIDGFLCNLDTCEMRREYKSLKSQQPEKGEKP